MIIWTTSWAKALSNEMPTGICVMNGIVIIMTSSIAYILYHMVRKKNIFPG
jgi:hypothetical protein